MDDDDPPAKRLPFPVIPSTRPLVCWYGRCRYVDDVKESKNEVWLCQEVKGEGMAVCSEVAKPGRS
jgi:hypothetical protein